MDIDPTEYVDADGENADTPAAPQKKSRLNAWVAVTVALLATFMGIGKVKDDNIVQAMQQAQADKLDAFSWYQARNVREEVMRATVATLQAQQAAVSGPGRAAFDKPIAVYQKMANEQESKKQQQLADADKAQKTYDALNYHDDQFDLSDALLSLAISLLALAALTQSKGLYVLGLVPTFFGTLMGLAGLFGWRIHPDALTRLLS